MAYTVCYAPIPTENIAEHDVHYLQCSLLSYKLLFFVHCKKKSRRHLTYKRSELIWYEILDVNGIGACSANFAVTLQTDFLFQWKHKILKQMINSFDSVL